MFASRGGGRQNAMDITHGLCMLRPATCADKKWHMCGSPYGLIGQNNIAHQAEFVWAMWALSHRHGVPEQIVWVGHEKTSLLPWTSSLIHLLFPSTRIENRSLISCGNTDLFPRLSNYREPGLPCCSDVLLVSPGRQYLRGSSHGSDIERVVRAGNALGERVRAVCDSSARGGEPSTADAKPVDVTILTRHTSGNVDVDAALLPALVRAGVRFERRTTRPSMTLCEQVAALQGLWETHGETFMGGSSCIY